MRYQFMCFLLITHLLGYYLYFFVNLMCKVCGCSGIVYFANTPGPQLLLPSPITAASMFR